MSTKIVVVNSRINDAQKKQITDVTDKYGAVVEFYSKNKDAIPHLAGAEIVYGFGPSLPKNAPDLKWFCSSSAGVDIYLKNDAFGGRDIILTNSSGSYGRTIAEHSIMMSIYMMRRMPEYQEIVDAHGWTTDYLPIKTFNEGNILVLGTGDLGSSFAKRVRGFEPASIIGISRSGNQVEEFDKVYSIDDFKAAVKEINESSGDGKTSKDLIDAIKSVDLLVMCLPGTPETTGILSKDVIAALPDDGYVVNVGRGSAVDEDALVEALNSGKLAGAALDVFVTEPLPEDSPLWDVPKLYITPHISGQETTDWVKNNNYNMFCEDLENYFNGRPLTHTVDISKGY